jgi:DNA-binding transcriptional ArsR family regulator
MMAGPLSPALLDAVAERFKVLAEPARLRILERLRHGRQHVNALVEAIADPQVFALCDLMCGQVERAAHSRSARLKRRSG